MESSTRCRFTRETEIGLTEAETGDLFYCGAAFVFREDCACGDLQDFDVDAALEDYGEVFAVGGQAEVPVLFA